MTSSGPVRRDVCELLKACRSQEINPHPHWALVYSVVAGGSWITNGAANYNLVRLLDRKKPWVYRGPIPWGNSCLTERTDAAICLYYLGGVRWGCGAPDGAISRRGSSGRRRQARQKGSAHPLQSISLGKHNLRWAAWARHIYQNFHFKCLFAERRARPKQEKGTVGLSVTAGREGGCGAKGVQGEHSPVQAAPYPLALPPLYAIYTQQTAAATGDQAPSGPGGRMAGRPAQSEITRARRRERESGWGWDRGACVTMRSHCDTGDNHVLSADPICTMSRQWESKIRRIIYRMLLRIIRYQLNTTVRPIGRYPWPKFVLYVHILLAFPACIPPQSIPHPLPPHTHPRWISFTEYLKFLLCSWDFLRCL